MGKKIILLIEDNVDDIKLTQRAFDKSDFTDKISLEIIRNGDDAIDYLFGQGACIYRDTKIMPTVILLDLNLPRINGFQILERIKDDERTKLIPVIVLTSSKEEKDIKKAYSLGANSYIRKPVDLKKFYNTAQQLGFYWFDLNESPLK